MGVVYAPKKNHTHSIASSTSTGYGDCQKELAGAFQQFRPCLAFTLLDENEFG
jgi:hypothetical protein